MKTNVNRISPKRITYIVLMILMFVLGELGLALYNGLLVDELVSLGILTLFFLLIVVISLMHSRLNNELVNENTSYGRLLVRLLLCWIVSGISLVLPDFLLPVMLISFIVSTVCTESLTIIISLYFCFIICHSAGLSSNVFYCYMILVLIASLISSYVKKTKALYRLDVFIIIICSNVFVPAVFYYLTYLEIKADFFLYGLVLGVVVAALFGIFYNKLYQTSQRDSKQIYEDILKPEYSLVKKFREYSIQDYNHAIKVSRLANICASEVGANADCAACGGFYYHIGKMLGQPEIDNTLIMANNKCFPRDVISILSEYNGVLNKPSSIESAIVHMVDTTVTKLESMDADINNTQVKTDIVIYQLFNELSNNGIYDESSVTMNQFLKIRDVLVNEESIL